MRRENFSRKREAILHVLQNTKVHPTAEWVYQELKPDFPDLSLGTVYRNLSRFKEAGTVRSLGVIGGQEHFDGNLTPHDHFLCTACGKILDLGSPAFMADLQTHLEQEGMRVPGHELLVHGLCAACQQEKVSK